jgi:hypothetical protein
MMIALDGRGLRRSYREMLVPLELAIMEAIEELETNDADPNLQAANLALHEAREKVADFVDGLNDVGQAALTLPTAAEGQCPACGGQNVPHTIGCHLPAASAGAK